MSTKTKPPRWVVGLAMIGMAVQVTIAADFFEAFTAPPTIENWSAHGESSLFQWNPAGHLDITWDSSRTNSYFYHKLENILAKGDDFTLAFDLTLTSITPGFREGKPGTFELAIGFIHLADATSTNFFRGKGTGTVKNLFELDYFPDTGLGATLWPAVWSTNAVLSYRDASDYTLIELPLNKVLHVELVYTAENRTLQTAMTADGQPFGPINSLVLSPTFTDFRVDAFAICSYSDEATSNSLLATAGIDNIRLTLPPPPVGNVTIVRDQDQWRLQFVSRTNWYYQAESSQSFDQWQTAGTALQGAGEEMTLPVAATDAITFWRVHATRP